MEHNPHEGGPVDQAHKTLRLTIKIADGKATLVSVERLNMICPPCAGASPEVGKHGGFWVELRNKERVLSHRVIHAPLGDIVEVHSPDGNIRKELGSPREHIFEVLLPDNPTATSVALMGESLEPAKTRKKGGPVSTELARFDLPKPEGGGQ